ncbi:MAG: hypothetical protein LBK98_01550 [Peptococcaceae bacterium]|jgi:hypothetical protein|nr:hypothetical protein [Peptococcaceae bacterium]
MSKPYDWEDAEYTRQLRQTYPAARKPWGFWLPPLIVSAVCYALLLARDLIISLFISGGRASVLARLEIDLYSRYAFFALLALPLLATLLFYAGALIIVPRREAAEMTRPSASPDKEERRRIYQEQYLLYTWRQETRWLTRVFYLVLLTAQLGLIVYNVFFTDARREAAWIYDDLNLLRAGDLSVYEGEFQPTDRPIHNTYGYAMIPDGEFYYFTSDAGTLRCLRNTLAFDRLARPAYRVEYLPNTYTVVSITNDDGVLLTGPDVTLDLRPPGGTWLYGDLIVQSQPEVYGYGLLSEGGQKAFDLMYGEYYSQAVALGKEDIHSFSLAQPITKEEYYRVLSLYEAATARYSRPPWRYDTNDTYPNVNNNRGKDAGLNAGLIKTVYAGGVSYSDPGLGEQFFAAREKAAAIVAALPPGLGTAGKCRWLAGYLAENAAYYTEPEPQRDFVDKNGMSIHIAISEGNHTTAYGALIEGRAESAGYAAAFAALAYEAGVPCLYVKGELLAGGSDDRGSDDRGSDDRGSDDRGSDDRGSDGEGAEPSGRGDNFETKSDDESAQASGAGENTGARIEAGALAILPGRHNWNMVDIDGNWYHIDATLMDAGNALSGWAAGGGRAANGGGGAGGATDAGNDPSGGGVDETYFLADDSRIGLTHRPISYGECYFAPLPASPAD